MGRIVAIGAGFVFLAGVLAGFAYGVALEERAGGRG